MYTCTSVEGERREAALHPAGCGGREGGREGGRSACMSTAHHLYPGTSGVAGPEGAGLPQQPGPDQAGLSPPSTPASLMTAPVSPQPGRLMAKVWPGLYNNGRADLRGLAGCGGLLCQSSHTHPPALCGWD